MKDENYIEQTSFVKKVTPTIPKRALDVNISPWKSFPFLFFYRVTKQQFTSIFVLSLMENISLSSGKTVFTLYLP